MNDLDIRRASLATKVKWGVGLLGALLISPVVFMIVQGLVGLIVAGVLGLAIINFAPYLGLKFANWKLKALKFEARENPIETRQNLALQARNRIALAITALSEFKTEVRNFEDQVKELRRTQPEDAADFEDQLSNLQKLQKMKEESLQQAIRNADEFEKATERADRKWKVAQSAIKMQKLAGSAANSALDKILAEESLESVQSAMNRALSDLDTTVALSALPAPSDVIDLAPSDARVKVER